MAINMFVSSAEEAFMKIPPATTKSYKEEYGIQSSNGTLEALAYLFSEDIENKSGIK